VARDAPLRARMGARGRDVARSEFSIEAMAEGTLREYRRLLVNVGVADGPATAAANAAGSH
jgi:hypothetical protein